jgi:hypothetical protein
MNCVLSTAAAAQLALLDVLRGAVAWSGTPSRGAASCLRSSVVSSLRMFAHDVRTTAQALSQTRPAALAVP